MTVVLGAEFWAMIIGPVAVVVGLVMVRRIFSAFLGRSV